jgi:hypothetical protein
VRPPRPPAPRVPVLVAIALLCAAALGASAARGAVREGSQDGSRSLASAAAWLEPPPVLPGPSGEGTEGPPRPLGVEPPVGAPAPRTAAGLLRAQNHALLYGPFPRGGLVRGISDSNLIMSENAEVRELALARIRAAGASVVRIPVEWRYIVSADPPAGFQASDPASPAYDFSAVDAAVRETVAAGLTPLLVVSRAPAFAEAPNRWPYAYPGSWAPDPLAFGEFAAAVARRYSGAFPDPLAPARTLPRVRLLQAWNEPNLARYLEPQWIAERGRWRAFSPLVYRGLLNAFYAAVKAVVPSDVVVAAGIAPNGEPAGVGRMTPVRFLRALLCLEGRCPDPPHFDVLAFHPLSFESPDHAAASSQDVAIADIAKVSDLLIAARKAGTALPRAHKALWITELNWESAPASPHGVPPRLQALWISRALHRLWVAGVALADWQFLVDPFPDLQLATPTGGAVHISRPAGLYSPGPGGSLAAARPKPFLSGFALPFDPLRIDRRHVRVWALLRGAQQPVSLQRRARGGAWRAIVTLRADREGVLNMRLALRGAAILRVVGAAGASAGERVPARRSPL